jgi:hypothetical protein
MEGEFFLSKAAIFHYSIVATHCYYMVIHFFILVRILLNCITIRMKGGEDLNNGAIGECLVTTMY